MKPEAPDNQMGHAVYTRRVLANYDWWVLGVSNRLIWRCPTRKLLALYRERMSPNHLEVGAGTGYFPAKTLPVLGENHPRLVLLDINEHCLASASARLADYRPETLRADILAPLPATEARPYDSIAIHYLLHCLPGAMEEKAPKVLDNLLPRLAEGGTLFGATILGAEVQHPLLARPLLRHYRRKGIFSNTRDNLGALMGALSARFKTFHLEGSGSVVMFWAKGRR